MTATNRVRVASIREVTLGTTPNTPRMRTRRFTGESIKFTPGFVDSDQIRSDRMNVDSILVSTVSSGGLNAELAFPVHKSGESEDICSAFCADWTTTPWHDNDGTADSSITDAGTSANTYAVADQSGSGGYAGTAYKANMLVQASGFTNAANNQVFAVASSTATTVLGTALSLTAEAAPPATARLKVVGFQGASGDVTATSTGLASSALDFTTLGLAVGQWIKIGGSAAGNKFATAACTGWARITAIAAHALTLDNKPTGWTTDAGTGKTVRCFFGDRIANGTTLISQSIEKGYLGQTVPTYVMSTGMVVDQYSLSVSAGQKITYSVAYKGMGGSQGTAANGTSYDAMTSTPVMAAGANVNGIQEYGSALSSPNWVRDLKLQIANNIRTVMAVDSIAPVDQRYGECTVTGSLSAYFGDNSILTRFFAGTPTSLSSKVVKNGQAVVLQIPRATYNGGGDAFAQAKNQDVSLNLSFKASYDSVTGAQVMMDRLEYVE